MDITGDSGHADLHTALGMMPSVMVTHAYLLHKDIDECSASLDNSISWWRTKPAKVQLALMHMRFQLGMTGVLKFKKTLALIQEDRFKEAAVEARDSRWAKQTARRAKYVTGLIEDA